MSVILSDEQRAAVTSQPGVPLRVLDPQSNVEYVLLPADVFERIKDLLIPKDYDLSETYAAQLESALRAGWGDPSMDDYDRYDECRKQP